MTATPHERISPALDAQKTLPGTFVSGRTEDEDFGKWDHLVAVVPTVAFSPFSPDTEARPTQDGSMITLTL